VEKNCLGGLSLHDSVRLTLGSYRCLPHPSLNWKTPAEVLNGRQPRCLLSLLNPKNNSSSTSTKTDLNQPQFAVDSLVYARNYAHGPKWLPGQITSKEGSAIYMINTDRGVWKRHANQLQIRLPNNDNSSTPMKPVPIPADNPLILQRRYPVRNRRMPDRYRP